MKLHNKKTGEIGHLLTTKGLDRYDIIDDDYRLLASYNSLAKVIKEWEEYESAEPLIKDEKIRKAVRAWAEANGASRAYIVDLGILRDESSGNEIKFNGEPFVGLVTSLKTIAELCGEEEE